LQSFYKWAKLLYDLIIYLHVPKEHEGALSFATNACTSPNHCAYIAITVHVETKGQPVNLLLDLVEVAKVWNTYHEVLMMLNIEYSHSGINLAADFAKILDDFGIGDKVSKLA